MNDEQRKAIFANKNKNATGKVIISNEKNERVGEFDFNMNANAGKIRDAKSLRIKSIVNGKVLDNVEVTRP